MAEETAATPARSGLVRTLIILTVVVLISAIFAVAAFQFIVRPMLNPVEAAEPEEHAGDHIPHESVTVDFPEMQATVLTADPDEAAPLLIFQVSLLCKNHETELLITERQSQFAAMINKYHRNRTRSELNDPYVQETLLRQIKQEANGLLKRLAAEAEELEVMEAFHLKFAIYDL